MAWIYCPDCGQSLEKRTERGGRQRPFCTPCERFFYDDPKVAAGCIVSDGGRLLMVKRAIEPSYGLWTFPGGFVDRGETVPAAAAREVLEESGIKVRIEGLLGVYSYPGRPIVVVVYTARALTTEFSPDDETLECAWLRAEEIPWEQLAFPSTTHAFRDYLFGDEERLLSPPLDRN